MTSLPATNTTDKHSGAHTVSATNSRWALILRNVLRQRSRNLLLGLMIFFASFVMVYFSQFLEGVSRNFSQNMIALVSGELYVSSATARNVDKNIFFRDYDYFVLPPAFYPDLAAIPGYASISPRLEFDAKLVTADDSVQQPVMAFDLASEARLKANFTLVEGRMIQPGEYAVIVPLDFAKRYHIRVGDTVRLLAKAVNKQVNLIDYRVSGLFTTNNLSATFDRYIYLDLPVARVLVDNKGALTRLNINLQSDSTPEIASAAQKAVTQLLAKHQAPANPALDVTPWAEGAAMFTALTGGLKASYSVVIVIIIIMMAASLAFSTMMNILERSKEIATLGALGAPPREIRRLLVGENLLLAGVAASAGLLFAALVFAITAKVGIPVSVKELRGFLGSSHFYPAFDAAGYMAGLLVPLLVALVSSWIFAGRAAKLPIAQLINDR